MKIHGLTVNLKDDPEIIEKYRQYHAEPWPEVMESLRAAGVLDMKIFLLGRRLFMYLATTDEFGSGTDAASGEDPHPRAAQWNELMNSFQEAVPEAGGKLWAPMEQVFDFHKH